MPCVSVPPHSTGRRPCYENGQLDLGPWAQSHGSQSSPEEPKVQAQHAAESRNHCVSASPAQRHAGVNVCTSPSVVGDRRPEGQREGDSSSSSGGSSGGLTVARVPTDLCQIRRSTGPQELRAAEGQRRAGIPGFQGRTGGIVCWSPGYLTP